MVKTITKIGNSQGLMFDAALMDLAPLKAGDQVNVEVHEGGTITITPLRPARTREEVSRVVEATLPGLRSHHEEAGISATLGNCFYLTVEIVREIHAGVIAKFGGSDGVRNMALLESAVAVAGEFRRKIAL